MGSKFGPLCRKRQHDAINTELTSYQLMIIQYTQQIKLEISKFSHNHFHKEIKYVLQPTYKHSQNCLKYKKKHLSDMIIH